MAHVEVDKREFERILGRSVGDQELNEKASDLGIHWSHVEGSKWDVEVYPNRPDLLSVEGLARAYRGFFDVYPGLEEYETSEAQVKVTVEESVESVRPYIGAAVIRGIELSEKKINGLIQLQEKLHETVGRRRDKIAIGLHDLSTVSPDFCYKAVYPEAVSFVPLEREDELNLGEILEEHEKGQEYSWILENDEKYPVIVDSDGNVLSFPPIINNQLTEVDTDTKDVFIDVTGKDRGTVQKVLNILATALSERGGEIEKVDVEGSEMPSLEPETKELDPDYFRSISGLELEDQEILERLESMKCGAELGEDSIIVKTPCYRTDIMHQYDLIEDVVIAHRYHNIEPELPTIDQIGERKEKSKFTDLLRNVLQGTGSLETHTYVLSSEEKLYDNMDEESRRPVTMRNALTEEYSVVRDSLMPSLMSALEENRHHSYPQRLFEVADVAKLDESAEGASNTRKVAFVAAGPEVDYTDAKEVLQTLERDLGIELEVVEEKKGCFKSGRSGKVVSDKGDVLGHIGEISEEVQQNWGIEKPVAGFELDVEKLMNKGG